MSEQFIALLLAGWGLLYAVYILLQCLTGQCDCEGHKKERQSA